MDWQMLEPGYRETGADFKKNAANFFFGTSLGGVFDGF